MLNTFERWANYINQTKTRWNKLGYILGIGALLYLFALLIFSGLQIRSINMKDYWTASLLTLSFYLLSLLAQLFIWMRLLSFHHEIGWRDIVIYSRTIVLRRLPGGIWHWLGRTALYVGTTKVPGRVVIGANFLEWILLFLIASSIGLFGWSDLSILVRIAGGSAAAAAALWLAYQWQPDRLFAPRIIESLAWLCLYTAAWILGGLIVYVFVIAAGGLEIHLFQAVWIWALAGGVSMFMVIIPAGMGIRELTLVWLLAPYLPASSALIVALLIRFSFLLADVLWGSLGWALGYRFTRDRNLPPENPSISSSGQ
jgi:hypothetical protein